ncbi:conserved hypothetical protein, secreted [Beggiatoa sp. PS]|nr:conserved hypothetical protein, secreted [Beggiatoa sp. PS]
MNRTTLLALGIAAVLPMTTLAQDDAGDAPKDAKRTSKSGRIRGATLFSATDIDFYRFDIKKSRDIPGHDPSGNLTVSFSQEAPPGANPKAGWRIDLFSEEDLANSLFTTTLKETSLEVKFEQGLGEGRYYYKISSLDSEVFPAAEYTLEGAWEESPNYEKSPNGDTDSATAIKVNEIYAGNLSSTNDIDVYRFGLETPDLVTISFSQESPDSDNTMGWQVRLLSPSLTEQPTIDLPSTVLQNTMQAQLDVGTHFIFVSPLPPANEEDKLKAPVGKRYALTANAASVPTRPTECEFVFTYAQNPTTQRWATFASPCDVPNGWFGQQTPPEDDSEVCPSPHASYTPPSVTEEGVPQPGVVQIPLLDYTDENGSFIFRVNLQQEGNGFSFILNDLANDLKLVRQVEDAAAVVDETEEEVTE